MTKLSVILAAKRGIQLAFVVCALITASCSATSDESNEWKKLLDSLGISEGEILCERRVVLDNFAIASTRGKILAVFRVDVTSSSGDIVPFIISWNFQDEHGSSLDSSIPPDTLVKRFARKEGKVFAEGAEFRELMLRDVSRLNVSIAVQKSGIDLDRELNQSHDLSYLDHIKLCVLSRSGGQWSRG